MKALYPFVVVIFALIIVSLSGCAGFNPLSGLTDKPEVTAQVGAENTKQLAGVTAKQDASSKQETTIKDSKVDRVDSSSRKQVKTSTIQANEIKADSIQVVNGGDTLDDLPVMVFSAVCMFLAGYLTAKLTNKKEA